MGFAVRIAAVGVIGLALAGCNKASQPAVASGPVLQPDGWTHYAQSGVTQTILCPPGPVSLDGNRTDLTLRGACRRVRVTGEHNDVTVDIMPAGTIEITGQHNDVFWRQVAPGPKPLLLDRGVSNTFHRREAES